MAASTDAVTIALVAARRGDLVNCSLPGRPAGSNPEDELLRLLPTGHDGSERLVFP